MKRLFLASFAVAVLAAFPAGAGAGKNGGVFGEAVRIKEAGGTVTSLCIDGKVLYAGCGPVLRLFDVSDPMRPRLLGEVSGLSYTRQIAVQDAMAYIATRECGLWIVDCTDPSSPRIRSRYDCCELATGVDVAGDVCFLGQRQNGVEFIDVSDPDNPRHIAMRKTYESQSVKYRDGYLYSGEWASGEVTVFDVRDMSAIRRVAVADLHGYGDGVWLQGDYLFCATGHHSRHRKVSGGIKTPELKATGVRRAGAGMGHGLDIFDVSDPVKPKHVSRLDYPPFYARGLDMWTPRTSGNLLFASQTHNGLFAVDIADRKKPKVLDRWVCPDPKHPEWPGLCVGGLAVTDGCVYAGVVKGGLFALPARGAVYEEFRRGKPPVNASWREKYPTDENAFHVWKPSREGQARGVAVSGDIVYAACGDAGLHVLRVRPEGGFEKIGELAGRAHVFDVVFDGELLCTAEGPDGFAFYRMDAPAVFREVGRIPHVSPRKCWAFWTWAAGRGRFVLSERAGGNWLFDVRDLSAPRSLLNLGGCPGWDKYMMDAPVGGGRYLAHNAAQKCVNWIDLDAVPEPTVKRTVANRINLYSGICRFSDDRALMTSKCRYRFLAPGECDPPDGSVWKLKDFPGPETSGIPRSDGRFVVKTCRINREITLYDFADPENPSFVGHWKVSGNPDTAVFHKGRFIVPCGHQGVLMHKRPATGSAVSAAPAKPGKGSGLN